MPGGIDDCSNKVELRCMASGENVGAPFAEWEPCTGATGLALASTDFSEFPGRTLGIDAPPDEYGDHASGVLSEPLPLNNVLV